MKRIYLYKENSGYAVGINGTSYHAWFKTKKEALNYAHEKQKLKF